MDRSKESYSEQDQFSVKKTASPSPLEATLKTRFITDVNELCERLNLPKDLAQKQCLSAKAFPLRFPESVLDRVTKGNVADPILKQFLPDPLELKQTPGFFADPLRENLATIPCKNGQTVSDEPSCILQKYIGRALVLTTNDCAARCRFCFRRSSLRRALFPIVDADQKKGSPQVENKAANGPDFNERLESVFAPVRANPSIHELVFSGGDPLTLSNDQLKSLLDYIKTLRAVNRVRFHSRVPILVPQRIDQGFPSSDDINRRDSSKTLILHISLHVNSPNEINGSVVNSLAELRRRGYLLTSQTVLLKGVNDSVEVLVELFEKLANAGVIPYYLHQLDHVQGAAHFETPVAKGLQLMKEIASRLPGYAVPRYVREIPGRAMKTDLQAEPDADVDYD